jgi:hypothetical protein
VLASALGSVAVLAAPPVVEPPLADSGRSTQMLSNLPRKSAHRVVVTTYEFRSSVSEIGAEDAPTWFALRS